MSYRVFGRPPYLREKRIEIRRADSLPEVTDKRFAEGWVDFEVLNEHGMKLGDLGFADMIDRQRMS